MDCSSVPVPFDSERVRLLFDRVMETSALKDLDRVTDTVGVGGGVMVGVTVREAETSSEVEYVIDPRDRERERV